ncbi:MAG: DNA alkylation repair protein [Planctomycetota bacterium]|nr:DNA alkylation repair protein [Planctomycetota bacterium]
MRVPKLRELAAELARRKPTLDEACELLDELGRDAQRDEFLVGVFVLAKQGKALARLEWKRFGRWIAKLDNWETCDQLAMGVAAPCVAARKELERELLALTGAASPWTRRFALATAAALNQKGRERVDLTLRICTELAASREPTLVKALSWALREAGGHDRARVLVFLEKNAAVLHRSVLREVAAALGRGT